MNRAEAADRGQHAVGAWCELGLFLCICLTLAAHQLFATFHHGNIPHLAPLIDAFSSFSQGQMVVDGPSVGHSNAGFGGGMYFWISYPIALFRNPLWGTYAWYGMLELVSITLWLVVGRWTSIPRIVLWTSAFLLVLFGGTRGTLLENFTLAATLLPAVFILTAFALETRAWPLIPLAGAAMAVVGTVHQAFIFLVPVVIGVFLAVGTRPLLRTLLYLIGFAAVVVPVSGPYVMAILTETHDGAPLAVGQMATASASRLKIGALVLYVLGPPYFPVALAGLGIGIVSLRTAWKGRTEPSVRPTAAHGDGEPSARPWREALRPHGSLILAGIWFSCAYLLMSMLLVAFGRQDDVSRFSMLYPARAVLGGVALVWIVAAIRRRCGEKARRWCAVPRILALTCLVAVTFFGVRTHLLLRTQPGTMPAAGEDGCTCGFDQDLSFEHSHALFTLYDEYRFTERFWNASCLYFDPHRDVALAFEWYLVHERRRTKDPGERRRSPHAETEAVAAPRIPGAALEEIEGAVDLGLFVVVPTRNRQRGDPPPDIEPQGEFDTDWMSDTRVLVRLQPESAREINRPEAPPHLTSCVGMSADPAGDRRSMVVEDLVSSGPPEEAPGEVPLLWSDGRVLQPQAGCGYCATYAGTTESICYSTWVLFDLAELEPIPDRLWLLVPSDLQPVEVWDAFWIGEPTPGDYGPRLAPQLVLAGEDSCSRDPAACR